ncbi:hypothetical protein [Gloeobacter kilaueensis]|uniref:Uncharacterized protein n=1 Tax=Gloeobacter kilaueensis (strain ATCC BAA-2537 / CCAP 1431/1 / ULC 316 / JS1) TaxID=1183438 RepID=U5QJE5_GLOK1|nr:hypothetical protein [Gloeobacter kilaueensis]AGY59107.1 hypothetical protein GKIL_2861 [Gloeobacter kilaueensis JS1]
MEERMDRAEQRLDQHGELLAELRASQLATNQNVDRLTSISERFIGVTADALVRLEQAVEESRASNLRLDQVVEELRASNRRQEVINDYLIRRDQERSNGSQG